MKVQALAVGSLYTNCYVAYLRETKDAVIIDPGFESASEFRQIFHFLDEATLKNQIHN